MSDLLNTFADCALDLDAVEKGRWFGWKNGAEFRIVAASSKAFSEEVERQKKPHRSLLEVAPDTEPAKQALKSAIVKAMAKAGITGLRRNGVDVEADAAAIESLLSEPSMDHLYRWVQRKMLEEDAFLDQIEDDDLGNSSTTSVGD